MPYTYKCESTIIPEVTGDFRPACGEAVLGMAASAHTSAAMLEFNKQVKRFLVSNCISLRQYRGRGFGADGAKATAAIAILWRGLATKPAASKTGRI